MPNAAPQMRVDIHLGKLRQGRFIPGPVGKKFAGNFLLRNERCRRIQEKSLVQMGNKSCARQLAKVQGPLTLPRRRGWPR